MASTSTCRSLLRCVKPQNWRVFTFLKPARSFSSATLYSSHSLLSSNVRFSQISRIARCTYCTDTNEKAVEEEKQDGQEENCVILLKGLPYKITVSEILRFLGDDVNVDEGARGVRLVYTNTGLPSGKAFVKCTTADDADRAMEKHNAYIGTRTIHVVPSTYTWAEIDRSRNALRPREPVERLAGYRISMSGLPFNTTIRDVEEFFHPLKLKKVRFKMGALGKPSGKAMVSFSTLEEAQQAMKKDRDFIKNRYIDLALLGKPDHILQSTDDFDKLQSSSKDSPKVISYPVLIDKYCPACHNFLNICPGEMGQLGECS